jgi:hypothetical protein
MKTRQLSLALIISLIVISQSFSSCIYRIKGKGKVVKSERQVKNIKSIVVKDGLDLILNQDTLEKAFVEANENLQKVIKTEVVNGELKIYTTEHIFFPSATRVYVTIKRINLLSASSGSDVSNIAILDLPELKVSNSSGADVKLALSCNDLQTESSSGSDISLSGKAVKLSIKCSSGSDVDAEKLNSEICSIVASSGSDVDVSVSRKIDAHASSGSDITVNGNPLERNIEKSSGGDVTFK